MRFLNVLSILFFVVGLAATYWFFIRPLLRARPQFADFYARTDSFWSALGMKLKTIRTKLAAVSLMAASALVEMHDFLLPAVTGIDWEPITSKVPAYVWPIASLAAAALFRWLYSLTAQRQSAVVEAVAAGATPAEAAIIAETAPAAAEIEEK